MDSTGAIYAVRRGDDGVGEVVRRPLDPGEATVVYRDSEHPVKTYGGRLVTGP
jgi:hypothetical protein